MVHSVDVGRLSLPLASLAKGRSIKDAPPPPKRSTSTQQLQTQHINPQQQTNFPPPKKQPATIKKSPNPQQIKPHKQTPLAISRMRMAIGFKAYSQNEKVRQTKNILQQPISVANTTSKPNPTLKKNKSPQKQTNTISRMRMAIGFNAYSQNEKVRYTLVCELFQTRIGEEDNAIIILYFLGSIELAFVTRIEIGPTEPLSKLRSIESSTRSPTLRSAFSIFSSALRVTRIGCSSERGGGLTV
jgi:hypothetical protein